MGREGRKERRRGGREGGKEEGGKRKKEEGRRRRNTYAGNFGSLNLIANSGRFFFFFISISVTKFSRISECVGCFVGLLEAVHLSGASGRLIGVFIQTVVGFGLGHFE